MATANAEVLPRPMTVQEFCDHYGLIREFVPFAYRKTDRVELMERTQAFLADLPKTAGSFTLTDVWEDSRIAGAWADPFLLAAGAWPHPGSLGATKRWVNPHYHHTDALAGGVDVEDRREHLRLCARLGVLTREDVARHCGISLKTLEGWLERHDIPWGEWRLDGVRRLARTLHTAVEWGYGLQDVTEVWPKPAGTVRGWIVRHARDTDFEPPADPSFDSQFVKGGPRLAF